MTPFVTACAGFLLAVLWFDLMFDVLILKARTPEAASEATRSIAAYYRRVTRGARPMNELVRAAMIGLIASLILQATRSAAHAWVAWGSLALTAPAVGLGMARTVRNAVRLGDGAASGDGQIALARKIARDHVVFFVAISLVLTLELVFARPGLAR